MQSKDEIKEELGWLKVIFGVLIVTALSIAGWLIQNFETAKRGILWLAIIGCTLLGIAILKLNAFAYEKIRSLTEGSS
jgi:hypothetical protein